MRVLVFYNASQTFTNTVFEHLNNFERYSKHDFFFCHSDEYSLIDINLGKFDAVAIHYSIRLPYNQISATLSEKLERYNGLKALFIQDEYDHTDRAGYWIKRLGIALVFTVVPTPNIVKVYPPDEFVNTRFVNNLTGYVPEKLPNIDSIEPPSRRPLIVGYRGRSLPLRYGQLGFEKVEIGRQVKAYCVRHNLVHDISWDEKDRIYGGRWYTFMASCRGMLGSESGSNVFDRDGKLGDLEKSFRKANPRAADSLVYADVVRPREIPGLMNQVSPRIFEAIALRTALVLYEGSYSGVVRPDEHFIVLRKDGANLPEVFDKLKDEKAVDQLTERAFKDVIGSGEYSYATFVGMVDRELELSAALLVDATELPRYRATEISANSLHKSLSKYIAPSLLTQRPIQAPPPASLPVDRVTRAMYLGWNLVPGGVRNLVRPGLKKILGRR